ncbi:MAG TPA: YifB family Mg chelatase-like AAA ATPase [Kineosporiaceae bacterium]|nr:YifB family Mg chelatase-like AAA ATPase [Kineosporiaceae bacterium]
MALGRALSVAIVGMEGQLVEVEADVTSGLPAFNLVGLPDASLNESRDRVRAATSNSGHALPHCRITVNLSPASIPKAGTGFDLAVAAALLSANGVAPNESVRRFVHLGELGLDGRVRPVRGVLPAALAAVRAGRPDLVVPAENAQEAGLVPGARVWPVRHLNEVIVLHGGDPPAADPLLAVDEPEMLGVGRQGRSAGPKVLPDLADVIGQHEGRRALEVAAAGGHHLLLVGPPGAGKTLLAARLPGVLPDLDDEQAVEVTAVHSLAGTLDPSAGLIRRPPFESPHHTATLASLVGGGSGLPRPGAASRAHRGILFIDEAAELRGHVLDALRQPLEDGKLMIHRAQGSAEFPARFQLVLATNPCPCGLFQGSGLECSCLPNVRRRYLSRLSNPLLDRIDLQVEVFAVSRSDLLAEREPESTATVAARVAAARAVQRERLADTDLVCNGEVSGKILRGGWRLPPAVTQDLDLALDRARLSIRGYDRVLRIAWTLCDLAGRTRPDRDDVGRALMLRQGMRAAA